MQPLDALSALTMGHHAADDDLLRWKWDTGSKRGNRFTCKKHLLLVLHRNQHVTDAKKFKPGTIELMIQRDRLDDLLRRGKIHLFEVRGDKNWELCAHCRMEHARKYGHLYR